MHTLEELGDRPRMSNNLANYMNAFVTAEQEFLDKYGTPNINFLCKLRLAHVFKFIVNHFSFLRNET